MADILCSDCDEPIHETGNKHYRERYCSKKHEFMPIPIWGTFQTEMCAYAAGASTVNAMKALVANSVLWSPHFGTAT